MSEFSTIIVDKNGYNRSIAKLSDHSPPDKICFVWLGGFRSDMRGTKAEALSTFCIKHGFGCVRFDYSGHGESGGTFEDGSISIWLEETLCVLETIEASKIVLVGSSMGGWISLLVAKQFAEQNNSDHLGAMVLIAPAPDFATELMEPQFTDVEKEALMENGFFEKQSDYSPEPVKITRKLIEDGRANCVLDKSLMLDLPILILQGMKDEDVPYQHMLRLIECLGHENVIATLVKDADHRCSRDQDIELFLRLCSQAAELSIDEKLA